jgi:preprotein translocase subunit SecG
MILLTIAVSLVVIASIFAAARQQRRTVGIHRRRSGQLFGKKKSKVTKRFLEKISIVGATLFILCSLALTAIE